MSFRSLLTSQDMEKENASEGSTELAENVSEGSRAGQPWHSQG